MTYLDMFPQYQLWSSMSTLAGEMMGGGGEGGGIGGGGLSTTERR